MDQGALADVDGNRDGTLWEIVQQANFSEPADQLQWKWTASGSYSSKSAYVIQFAGSYCSFNCQAIWKAKAEGKHSFFVWLLVQERIQTADNLRLKGIQCDPICCLCDQELETASHLCLHCVYAREVWSLVSAWTGGMVAVPTLEVDIKEWRNSVIQAAEAAVRPKVAAILMYTSWNIWNERNRRVFQGVMQSPTRILGLIKAEMDCRRQACEGREAILVC